MSAHVRFIERIAGNFITWEKDSKREEAVKKLNSLVKNVDDYGAVLDKVKGLTLQNLRKEQET